MSKRGHPRETSRSCGGAAPKRRNLHQTAQPQCRSDGEAQSLTSKKGGPRTREEAQQKTSLKNSAKKGKKSGTSSPGKAGCQMEPPFRKRKDSSTSAGERPERNRRRTVFNVWSLDRPESAASTCNNKTSSRCKARRKDSIGEATKGDAQIDSRIKSSFREKGNSSKHSSPGSQSPSERIRASPAMAATQPKDNGISRGSENQDKNTEAVERPCRQQGDNHDSREETGFRGGKASKSPTEEGDRSSHGGAKDAPRPKGVPKTSPETMSTSELAQVMSRRKKLRSEVGHSDLCLWEGLPNDLRMPRLVNKNKVKVRVASKTETCSMAKPEKVIAATSGHCLKASPDDDVFLGPLLGSGQPYQDHSYSSGYFSVMPSDSTSSVVKESQGNSGQPLAITKEKEVRCDLPVGVGAHIKVDSSFKDLDRSTETDQKKVDSKKGLQHFKSCLKPGFKSILKSQILAAVASRAPHRGQGSDSNGNSEKAVRVDTPLPVVSLSQSSSGGLDGQQNGAPEDASFLQQQSTVLNLVAAAVAARHDTGRVSSLLEAEKLVKASDGGSSTNQSAAHHGKRSGNDVRCSLGGESVSSVVQVQGHLSTNQSEAHHSEESMVSSPRGTRQEHCHSEVQVKDEKQHPSECNRAARIPDCRGLERASVMDDEAGKRLDKQHSRTGIGPLSQPASGDKDFCTIMPQSHLPVVCTGIAESAENERVSPEGPQLSKDLDRLTRDPPIKAQTAVTETGSSDIRNKEMLPDEGDKDSPSESSALMAPRKDLAHYGPFREASWREGSGASNLLHSLLSGTSLDECAGRSKGCRDDKEFHGKDARTNEWSKSYLNSLLCFRSEEHVAGRCQSNDAVSNGNRQCFFGVSSEGVDCMGGVQESESMNRDRNVCPVVESAKDLDIHQAKCFTSIGQAEDTTSNVTAGEVCSPKDEGHARRGSLDAEEQVESVSIRLSDFSELETVCKGSAEETTNDKPAQFSAESAKPRKAKVRIAHKSTAPSRVQSETEETSCSDRNTPEGDPVADDEQSPGEHFDKNSRESSPEKYQKDLTPTQQKTPRKSASPLVILTRQKARTPEQFSSRSGTAEGGRLSESVFHVLPYASLRKRRKPPLDLLGDHRLGKYACTLWSSEQRRRLQQEHPKVSSSELDDMLRSRWDKLSDKEKVRYYQRARSAVSDRERAGAPAADGRQHSASGRTAGGGTTLRDREVMSPEEFVLLPPHLQLDIVQRKLRLVQRSLGKAEFQKFVQGFAASFKSKADTMKARNAKGLKKNAATEKIGNEKAEGRKERRKALKTNKKKREREEKSNYFRESEEGDSVAADEMTEDVQAHLDSVARRLLYTQITELEPKIQAAKLRKVVAMRNQMLCYYRALVNRIILAEDVTRFQSDDVRSRMVTDALHDLETIDLADATGEQLRNDVIMDIEEDLRCGSLAGTCRLTIGNEKVLVPNTTNSYFAKSLFTDACCRDPLPELDPQELEETIQKLEDSGDVSEEVALSYAAESLGEPFYRSAAGAIYRQTHGTEPCCALESPSCVLTDLLVADKLNQVKTVLYCRQKSPLNSLLR